MRKRGKPIFPNYESDVDFTTNSTSYLDDLGRKNTLIKMLAKRIWEYDKILAESLAEIEKILEEIIFKIGEGFNEEIYKLLIKWLEDGTLDHIINEVLMNKKADITYVDGLVERIDADIAQLELDLHLIMAGLLSRMEELDAKTEGIEKGDFTFNYKDLEPLFYTNLGNYRNAVNQCFRIDTYTNQIIASQADNNDPEGFVLNRLNPSGQFISKMDILQGGHGTVFGLDRVTNGDLKVWYFHEPLGKLVQFEYVDNGIMTLDQAKGLTDFTPASLQSQIFYVTYDQHFDYLVFFRNDGYVQIHNREDVRNGIDNILFTVQTDKTEMGSERAFQGFTSFGTDVYSFNGWGALDSVPRITKYDVVKQEKVETYPLNKINGPDGVTLFRDDFREPEGIEFFVNPYNGKHSLLFCLTTGGTLKRHHLVYGLHQSGGEEHFNSLVKINAQNYAYTRSDGRAFQIKDDLKDLNTLFASGYYYIKDDVFGTLTGKPDFPVGTKGDGSWWLEVKPADQYFTVRQILTRLSYTPKNIQFERTISLGRDQVGDWNLIKSESLTHANFAQPADWGNSLAGIVIPDTYYITTAMSVTFTDHPEPNYSGWWFKVSTRSSDNRVEQRLIINNDTFYREYRRLVNVTTKTAVTSWQLLDYDSIGGDLEEPRKFQIAAADYDNDMDNVTDEGEYYVTSAQIALMSNAPSTYAGWFNVSKPSSTSASGIVIQTHIRNGATNYTVNIRRVTKGGGATPWTTITDLLYGDELTVTEEVKQVETNDI